MTTAISLHAWLAHTATSFRSLPFYLVALLLHLLFVLLFFSCPLGAPVSSRQIAIFDTVTPAPASPADVAPPPTRPETTPAPPTHGPPRGPSAAPPALASITSGMPAGLTAISPSLPLRSTEPGMASPPAPPTLLTLPETYRRRITEQSRREAIKSGMGSERGEGAVLRALNWLRANQNADGSWGGHYRCAMTGLALLTLLAHGETQASRDYGESVCRGVQWLLEAGRRNNGRLAVEHAEYQHAIAAYALAEDYAMTQNADILGAVEKAVAVIVSGQAPNGSWDYGYNNRGREDPKRPGGDLSITGWNIQALKAARNAGVKVGGLDAAMRRALGFVQSVYDEKSRRFGYATRGGGSDALGGVGMLSMLFLDAADSREVRGVLGTARQFRCRWSEGSEASSYAWYYITQGMFQCGRAQWASWNREFRDEIIKHQMADGHWPPPGSAQGPWRQVSDPRDAQVYHTTLLCMMLEVYYRFLPTFR